MGNSRKLLLEDLGMQSEKLDGEVTNNLTNSGKKDAMKNIIFRAPTRQEILDAGLDPSDEAICRIRMMSYILKAFGFNQVQYRKKTTEVNQKKLKKYIDTLDDFCALFQSDDSAFAIVDACDLVPEIDNFFIPLEYVKSVLKKKPDWSNVKELLPTFLMEMLNNNPTKVKHDNERKERLKDLKGSPNYDKAKEQYDQQEEEKAELTERIVDNLLLMFDNGTLSDDVLEYLQEYIDDYINYRDNKERDILFDALDYARDYNNMLTNDIMYEVKDIIENLRDDATVNDLQSEVDNYLGQFKQKEGDKKKTRINNRTLHTRAAKLMNKTAQIMRDDDWGDFTPGNLFDYLRATEPETITNVANALDVSPNALNGEKFPTWEEFNNFLYEPERMAWIENTVLEVHNQSRGKNDTRVGTSGFTVNRMQEQIATLRKTLTALPEEERQLREDLGKELSTITDKLMKINSDSKEIENLFYDEKDPEAKDYYNDELDKLSRERTRLQRKRAAITKRLANLSDVMKNKEKKLLADIRKYTQTANKFLDIQTNTNDRLRINTSSIERNRKRLDTVDLPQDFFSDDFKMSVSSFIVTNNDRDKDDEEVAERIAEITRDVLVKIFNDKDAQYIEVDTDVPDQYEEFWADKEGNPTKEFQHASSIDILYPRDSALYDALDHGAYTLLHYVPEKDENGNDVIDDFGDPVFAKDEYGDYEGDAEHKTTTNEMHGIPLLKYYIAQVRQRAKKEGLNVRFWTNDNNYLVYNDNSIHERPNMEMSRSTNRKNLATAYTSLSDLLGGNQTSRKGSDYDSEATGPSVGLSNAFDSGDSGGGSKEATDTGAAHPRDSYEDFNDDGDDDAFGEPAPKQASVGGQGRLSRLKRASIGKMVGSLEDDDDSDE